MQPEAIYPGRRPRMLAAARSRAAALGTHTHYNIAHTASIYFADAVPKSDTGPRALADTQRVSPRPLRLICFNSIWQLLLEQVTAGF